MKTKRILALLLSTFMLSSLAFGEDIELVEGWTGDLDFVLKASTDNEPGGAPVNLTGMTVELLLYRNDKTLVNTTADITVLDAVNGEVRYSPDASDLVASEGPLRVRFMVTDAVGKVVFFPSGREDRWLVRSP